MQSQQAESEASTTCPPHPNTGAALLCEMQKSVYSRPFTMMNSHWVARARFSETQCKSINHCINQFSLTPVYTFVTSQMCTDIRNTLTSLISNPQCHKIKFSALHSVLLKGNFLKGRNALDKLLKLEGSREGGLHAHVATGDAI